TLQVGEVATEVVVSGEASLLETSSATISNLVDARKVLDLPLNNRDLTQLAYLQPGIIKVPQRARQGHFSGMGSKLSVAGARGTQNVYLLDGMSNSDLSGNAQGASSAYIGAETVKEFQIITNNYSAEYPSKAGGIISAVTKSGTNSLHGSIFEFLRNDNLDAANFFDNISPTGKPEFKRNQFGFSLGGPIVKDRTFFFTSYEGLREILGGVDFVRVPYRLASDPDKVIFTKEGKTRTADPVTKPFLDLFPVATSANFVKDFKDGSALLSGARRQDTDDDFFSIKIDHELGPGALGSLSGTYNYDHGTRDPFGFLFQVTERLNQGFESKRHVLSVGHTSVISPTALNEFRFGYSFTEPTGQLPLTTRDFSGLTFVPGRKLMGQLNVGRVHSLGFRVENSTHSQKALTIEEGLSLNRGNHSLKLGASMTRFRYRQLSFGRGFNGIYAFKTLKNFLKNKPRRLDVQRPIPCPAPLPQSARCGDDPERNLTQLMFGAYIQDDWKATSSLTWNLGLRYEFVTVPEEDDGKLSNFRSIFDPATEIGLLYNNATLKSFSPRIGFAWALGRQTSLRGGAGIFYDHPMFYHIRTSLSELPPFIVAGRLEDKDFKKKRCQLGKKLLFPNAFTEQFDCLRARPNIRPIESDQNPTYMYRWNLTLQQAVGEDWVFSAGYTGTRGLHLWTQNIISLNQWEGYPNPPTGPKFFPFTLDDEGEVDETADPINPNWADMRLTSSNVNSYYHGLALGVRKRLSAGLALQASYTFSKAIDQGAGVTSGGDQLPQSQRGVWYYDMHLKRSLSSQHIATWFSSNFTYEFPGNQNLSGFAKQLVNGWQINGIVTISDGYPFSVLDINRDQDDIIGDEEGIRANLIPGGNDNPVLG
ncbi:TonB-dependent receptor, partial [Acidobacteria bacterium AH-259-D05]|nr:TonB-dependent receptor [Acidobacteria bacterium AH-259-D05]